VLEKRGRLFEEFWYDKNTKTIYFIGKDNIPFHAVILPAMLIASDNRHPLPTVISSTEYLLYEGEKFSKSRRIGLWADEALYILEDPDYWRFSLVRMRPEERDTNFSWKEFMRIVNSELNDDIGNFIYRILSFIDRYFESRIPEPGEFDDIDREVINSVKASYNGYIDKMLETRIKQASEYILEIARTGNQYINRRAPWDEIKRDHRRAGTTMYIAINIVAILTLTLYPITPGAAQKIWAMIGFEEPIERTRYNRNNIFVVNSGRSIGKLEAPFKKLSQDFLARISIIVEDARKKAQEDRPPHLRF